MNIHPIIVTSKKYVPFYKYLLIGKSSLILKEKEKKKAKSLRTPAHIQSKRFTNSNMQIKAHTQSPLSPQAGEQTRPRASERVYTNSLEEEKKR